VIRRLRLKRLQEVDLRPEESLALMQRLETNTCSDEDRQTLAQVMQATQATTELLAQSTPPVRSMPGRHAKRKRQLAKASRRRNRR
jgi:hypothetical protein